MQLCGKEREVLHTGTCDGAADVCYSKERILFKLRGPQLSNAFFFLLWFVCVNVCIHI